MGSKRYANVNTAICVSCGACTKVCPKDAISIFKGCYATVDTALCVGCGICSRTCPANCITIREREELQ